MLNPKSRVVMVSGATGGIGGAVMDQLLKSGFSVSAGVRDPGRLPSHERLFGHHYDAEFTVSARDWVAATMQRFGAIHGLVNAAGIYLPSSLLDADERNLDAMWLINVKAPLRVIREVLPHLKASGDGRLVNVGSMAGKRVLRNVGYSVCKFALNALTQAVRREAWEAGVRAVTICPSFVATSMSSPPPDLPREKMTDPRDLAVLIENLLLLPNTASVAELLVNCRFEDIG